MQNTSALYNTIYSGPHTHEVKLNIAGRDYGMDTLASLKTSLTPFGTGSPSIGLAPVRAASALYPLPAVATGSLVPPSALNSESRPSLDGLANAISGAIASALQLQGEAEPVIKVYLDGRQLSDAVTKYQRREARASG